MRLRSASLVVAACTGALLAGAPAYAHHSIQAVVDTDTDIVGTMILTKVDWINPHAWFHFTMKEKNGTVLKDVMIEWLSVAGLKQAGYPSANVFVIGDTFSVTYHPNRDGSPGGHLVQMMDQEDGTVFSE